jgi:voltage-gated potassium channel
VEDQGVTGTLEQHKSPTYLVFMLFVSLFALGVMALELTSQIAPESKEIIDWVDVFLCLLFFIDFVFQLVRAKDRKKYLLTWGLLDLASCVPMVDALRWARGVRMMRIIRVLRCARSARILVRLLFEKKVQSTAFGGVLLVTVMVTAASISILHFESGVSAAKLTTAEDAMLTIGYEKVPVTTEGWALGAVLGFLGLGIFGAFSGLVAYWLLGSDDSETAAKLEALRREMASLKDVIAGRPRDPSPEPQTVSAGDNVLPMSTDGCKDRDR